MRHDRTEALRRLYKRQFGGAKLDPTDLDHRKAYGRYRRQFTWAFNDASARKVDCEGPCK